jgi:hypothetical protein
LHLEASLPQASLESETWSRYALVFPAAWGGMHRVGSGGGVPALGGLNANKLRGSVLVSGRTADSLDDHEKVEVLPEVARRRVFA